MIYLDSSALVKLALTEPESAALARWLADGREPLVSSALHRAEVPRAVWRRARRAAAQLPRDQADRAGHVDADVLDNSATLPPQDLSPALAIHLASALALKGQTTAFVAYDDRLLAAATDIGLPVASPA